MTPQDVRNRHIGIGLVRFGASDRRAAQSICQVNPKWRLRSVKMWNLKATSADARSKAYPDIDAGRAFKNAG